MTATLVAGLVALVAIVIVGVCQVRQWGTWQRRARRAAAVDRILDSGDAASVAVAGDVAGEVAVDVRPTNPVDRLALWVRRKNGGRKGLSILVGVLVVIAVGIVAYPLMTDLWANRSQNHLRNELNSDQLRQDYRADAVDVGDALTRIQIPDINVDVVVVQGTTTSALRAGAGHYKDTPLPCLDGNVGIAGHRTTYGKPFHDLQQLKVGDKIVLETPIGQCTYHVNKAPFSVLPSQVSVLDPDPANPATLTLTTCDPPGSAARRLIVQATLEPAKTKTVAPSTNSSDS